MKGSPESIKQLFGLDLDPCDMASVDETHIRHDFDTIDSYPYDTTEANTSESEV